MSTKTTPADKSADDEPEVEKTVTVEGYAAKGETYDGWREWAAALVPDIDWYSRSEHTSTEKYLVIGGERVKLSSTDAENITEAIAANPDEVGVRVEKVEETEMRDDYSEYETGWEARNRLMEQMPDELAGLSKSRRQYKQDRECVCSISASAGQSRVLTHHAERSDDNRYETDEKRRSVTITFKLGPAPKSDVEEWSEAIIGVASKELATFDCISKVRVASCTEERQGDCFL